MLTYVFAIFSRGTFLERFEKISRGERNGKGKESFPKVEQRKGKGKLYLFRPGNGKETLYQNFWKVDIAGFKVSVEPVLALLRIGQ